MSASLHHQQLYDRESRVTSWPCFSRLYCSTQADHFLVAAEYLPLFCFVQAPKQIFLIYTPQVEFPSGSDSGWEQSPVKMAGKL